MDSIVGLGNRITYNFVAPGATKSHTSLDNIVNLGNRITYEIVYDFRRDRTTVELCSCKMHGETNLMITYDVTESCPDLPDWEHISPRKVNYGFSKKFETAEIHIFNYPETFKGMGKFLVCNSPLSHQILMDIRSFCICQTPIETNDFPNAPY